MKYKVLIPNATGPINTGDQAILISLLDLLKSVNKDFEIVIHSSMPKLYNDIGVSRIDFHLAEWVLESNSSFGKFWHLLELITIYFFIKFHLPLSIFGKKIRQLVTDYQDADLIVFVGGGSLRSKRNLSDGLILCLLSSMYFYAKLFKTPKIITPISFGPFKAKWHEWVCIQAVKNFDLISLRESFSYKLLEKNNLKNLLLSKDMALLLKSNNKKNQSSKPLLIGFTIRKWLNEIQQAELEKNIASAIIHFTEKNDCIIQPIVQVDSPNMHEDDDYSITLRVVRLLEKENVTLRKIIRLKSLKMAIKSYGALDLIIGMRMHSNIIAATQGVPFLAISYEYKTDGISQDLGVFDYCIKCREVTAKNLYQLLLKLYRNRKNVAATIGKNLSQLRTEEKNKWQKIFVTI